jgi:spore maturation protein CgeB
MPLGCDYEAWNSLSLSRQDHRDYDCDISFVGSTYEEKCRYNQLEDIPEYIKGYVDGLIQAQINVYGYNFIEDSLTEEFCRQFKEFAAWYPLGEDYVEDVPAIIADSYIGYKCTEQERILTLKNISEHYSLDLYTQSPVHHFPKIHYRGAADSNWMMPKIFKCSKINLNMTNRPIKTGLPLRIFDIMGTGGFLLSNYQAEIPELFEVDHDLVVYDSQADLLDKIGYYLQHEEERLEIARNGQEKIKQCYTYKQRLQQIIEICASLDNEKNNR